MTRPRRREFAWIPLALSLALFSAFGGDEPGDHVMQMLPNAAGGTPRVLHGQVETPRASNLLPAAPFTMTACMDTQDATRALTWTDPWTGAQMLTICRTVVASASSATR